MVAKIFINLPVANLQEATAFYEAIGFVKNPQFSDERASGLAYDETIHVMLLTHGFIKTFIPHKDIADSHKTCEVLNALQLESREAVDAFVKKAVEAGGKALREPYDHGFMYGYDFEDLDWHIREPFRMDASQMPQE